MSPLVNAGLFLISTFFYIFISLVLLRLFFIFARVDFRNPLSELILKLTGPLVNPIRKIIPLYTRFEIPSALVLVLLQICEIVATVWLQSGILKIGVNTVIFSVGNLIAHGVGLMTFLIFIGIIASWIPQLAYNPVFYPIQKVTEPVLTPFRRILPPISGFDFSPILAIIGLQLITFLVAQPIQNFGSQFSL